MSKLVICLLCFLQAAVAFIPSSLPSSSSFNLNVNLAQSTTSRKAENKGRLYMMDGNIMTLNRFMMDHVREKPEHQDLEGLLSGIQMACKTISNLVGRAGIQDLTGLQGGINVQGEEQKKLDVISNDVLKNALRFTGKLGVVASEEEDHPVLVEESFDSKYVAVFDPLDGSSNIDAAISTGTIFGIFEEKEECLVDPEAPMTEQQMSCLLQTLQSGKNLVASGYCMYSSSTILVLTLGNGSVHGFTLDSQIGEFVLTHPNIRIPSRGKIYSVNEANYYDWDPNLQTYINNLKTGKGESGEKYSSRYIGSMVGDVHRTLLYGGIFAYPGDKKNPSGKLRLLYEGAPMAYIVENAGGKAITGDRRIMEVEPKTVHQRVPTFLGSKEDVEEVEKALTASAKSTEKESEKANA